MAARIKYYTDEQVSKAVIRGLRNRGIDVLTTKEAGMMSADDISHLHFAAERGRVIFTHDTDFLRLNAQGVEHCGIVYIHQNAPIGYIIRGLVLLYQVLDAEDLKNRVEYL